MLSTGWEVKAVIDQSVSVSDNSVMIKKTSKPVKSSKDYPPVTHGSQVAARGRRKANKMTDAQREEYFRRGMVMIYGSQPSEKAVAGHKRLV
jgi:hypothetical protein